MIKSFLIFLISSIVSLPAFAQTQDFNIQFDVNSSNSGVYFIIEIAKVDSILSLLVAKRDSMSWVNQKDSTYLQELLKDYQNDRISAQSFVELSEPLFNKYQHYTKDSVVIEKENPLNRDIQKFLTTLVADLRKESNIVIDGHSISIMIKYNGKFDRFYVISPNAISVTLNEKLNRWEESPNPTPYSEIGRLISSALTYYRSKNPKILLTERETLGY